MSDKTPNEDAWLIAERRRQNIIRISLAVVVAGLIVLAIVFAPDLIDAARSAQTK
jgi:hypothetical protein